MAWGLGLFYGFGRKRYYRWMGVTGGSHKVIQQRVSAARHGLSEADNTWADMKWLGSTEVILSWRGLDLQTSGIPSDTEIQCYWKEQPQTLKSPSARLALDLAGSEVGCLSVVGRLLVGGGWPGEIFLAGPHQYTQFDWKSIGKFMGMWVGAGSQSSPNERDNNALHPLGPRRRRGLRTYQGRLFKLGVLWAVRPRTGTLFALVYTYCPFVWNSHSGFT